MGVDPIYYLIAGTYLFASIPFALIIGYAWKRIDIRNFGSGNIGASNVLRLLGWPAALLCFLLDAGKGFVPVWIAIGYLDAEPFLVMFVALAAIVGHNASIFLKFKGGKGVATGLGVLIGLVPHIAVIAFFLWILLITVTRYISVASMVTGVSVPLLMLLSSNLRDQHWGRPVPEEYIYLAVVGAGYIVLKHRTNIIRLMNGTEARIGQRVRVENATQTRLTGRSDDDSEKT